MNINLPDPLTLPGGGIATTSDQWQTLCRPHLAALVLSHEYGAMPPLPQEFRATIARSDSNALDGIATLREIEIHAVSPDADLKLLVITPNAASSPVACFLGLNFMGNQAALSDSQRWPIETIIARGYAIATLFNGDAVPDNPELASARLADFVPPGMPATAGDAPATIACWAWTLSRALDYLTIDPSIDAGRIALMGHSRNGKTALLAGAMDRRAAMVIACQSGCGGMGPSRDIGDAWDKRESVQQINTMFPHWFCRNFKNYNSDPNLLPFDQHVLLALCAPRPVLLASAADDLWANPAGSFAMLRAADPVYRLLTGEGIDETAMPEIGTLIKTRLGHFIRSGSHAVIPEDWAAWLDYADVWL